MKNNRKTTTKTMPISNNKPSDHWQPELRDENRFRFIDPEAIPAGWGSDRRYIDIPDALINKDRVRAQKSNSGWEWAWEEPVELVAK